MFFLKICNCTLWKDWSTTVTNQHFLHGCTKRKKLVTPTQENPHCFCGSCKPNPNATGPRKKPSQATCMNGNGDGGVALNVPLRRHHIAKQIKVCFLFPLQQISQFASSSGRLPPSLSFSAWMTKDEEDFDHQICNSPAGGTTSFVVVSICYMHRTKDLRLSKDDLPPSMKWKSLE